MAKHHLSINIYPTNKGLANYRGQRKYRAQWDEKPIHHVWDPTPIDGRKGIEDSTEILSHKRELTTAEGEGVGKSVPNNTAGFYRTTGPPLPGVLVRVSCFMIPSKSIGGDSAGL
jgi:hypothetical protein